MGKRLEWTCLVLGCLCLAAVGVLPIIWAVL